MEDYAVKVHNLIGHFVFHGPPAIVYHIDGRVSYVGEDISRENGDCRITGFGTKEDAVPWKNETRRNYFVLFSIGGFSGELKAIAESRGDVFLA
jgi:hypothetical protein